MPSRHVDERMPDSRFPYHVPVCGIRVARRILEMGRGSLVQPVGPVSPASISKASAEAKLPASGDLATR